MESASDQDGYSTAPEVYVTMDSFSSFDTSNPDLQLLLKPQTFIKYKGSGQFGTRRCYISPSLHKLVLEKVGEEDSARGHCILVEDIVFIETGFSSKLASALARVNKSPMHHAIRITTNRAFIELSTDEKGLRDNWAFALKSLVKASKEFHSAQGFRLYCNLRMERVAEETSTALQNREVAALRMEIVKEVLEDVLVKVPVRKNKRVTRIPPAVYKWLNFGELFAMSQTGSKQRRQVQDHLSVLETWRPLAITSLQHRSYSWCLFLRIFFAKTKFKRTSASLSEESAELIDRDINLGRMSRNVEAYNVLKAVCQQHPDVGYCQGMHLLTDFLFRVLRHEKHVLGAMLVLMNPPYCLAEVFKPGFPKLQLLQYQLQVLVKLKLPALRDHLKHVDLDLNTITAPWILTLLTSTSIPEDVLRRVWDLFWVGNWSMFLSFLLTVLNLSQEHVIGESMEGTIAWYATGLSDLNYTRAFALVPTYSLAEGLLQDLEAAYEAK